MAALVSVMMPAYNAGPTLPMALASLVAQTYPAWECVLVDDGSTDGTADLADALNEPRIRVVRLPRNQGRAIARQVALEHATGELLCFLDADDWLYPSKLQRQTALLAADPDIAVVATGVAVFAGEDRVTGVRHPMAGRSPRVRWNRLARPPIDFPTCMVRMALARTAAYDPRLLLAQDLGFLLTLLLGRELVALPDPLYAYRESTEGTFAKLIQTRRYERRLYWSYRRTYPAQAAREIGIATAKEAVYRAGALVGLQHQLVVRRSQPPTVADVEAFAAAHERVAQTAATLAPGPAAPT